MQNVVKLLEQIEQYRNKTSETYDLLKKIILIEKFKNDLKLAINHHNSNWTLSQFDMDFDMARGRFTKWRGFGIQFDQTHNLSFRCEFEDINLQSLFWGIRRENEQVPNEKNLWQHVGNIMSSEFDGTSSYSQWWPWYNRDLSFLIVDTDNQKEEMADWNTNTLAWDIIAGEDNLLVKNIVQQAEKVYQLFLQNDQLDLLKAGQ